MAAIWEALQSKASRQPERANSGRSVVPGRRGGGGGLGLMGESQVLLSTNPNVVRGIEEEICVLLLSRGRSVQGPGAWHRLLSLGEECMLPSADSIPRALPAVPSWTTFHETCSTL